MAKSLPDHLKLTLQERLRQAGGATALEAADRIDALQGLYHEENEHRARLAEALRTYGHHLHGCDLTRRGLVNGGACSCGWENADPDRLALDEEEH